MWGFLKRLLGDNNDKEIKRMQKTVDKINAMEADLQNLTDSSLAANTDKFKERLTAGETLDDILPTASGWGIFISSSAFQWGLSSMTSISPRASMLTAAT